MASTSQPKQSSKKKTGHNLTTVGFPVACLHTNSASVAHIPTVDTSCMFQQFLAVVTCKQPIFSPIFSAKSKHDGGLSFSNAKLSNFGTGSPNWQYV